MIVKAGIKKFGDKGNDVVSKELRQLHDRRAMVPVKKDELSTEDKKRALRYLMFIKEKRDGAIKARGCTDGRPQRQYTEKSDASSPTVSLEAMMISCCIDAKEYETGGCLPVSWQYPSCRRVTHLRFFFYIIIH